MDITIGRCGPVKTIFAAGTHTKTWTADTKYGIGTIGGIYAPAAPVSKRIVYKIIGTQPYYALLEIDTQGNISLTPLNVASGGTLRIYETYL